MCPCGAFRMMAPLLSTDAQWQFTTAATSCQGPVPILTGLSPFSAYNILLKNTLHITLTSLSPDTQGKPTEICFSHVIILS